MLVVQILAADWCKYNDCVIATGSVDKTIKTWDVRMPQREVAVVAGHTYAVRRWPPRPPRPPTRPRARPSQSCGHTPPPDCRESECPREDDRLVRVTLPTVDLVAF